MNYRQMNRVSKEEISRQVNVFANNSVLEEFLTKIPSIYIIINESRQVVFLSGGAIQLSVLEDLKEIMGKRPGEVFGCIHTNDGLVECGKSNGCTYCGALNAVIECLETNKSAVQEAHLYLGHEKRAFDLRVFAAPITVGVERFILVTLTDISDEKWRAFLERTFFHDLLNKLFALSGMTQLLKYCPNKEDLNQHSQKIGKVIRQAISEIKNHQTLLMASKENLNVESSSFNAIQVVKDLVETYSNSVLIEGKTLVFNSSSENIILSSDIVLLNRILENMIVNALEATAEGGQVTISCNKTSVNCVTFSVNNPGLIPADVQAQIFKRTFSTKGKGRGYGTYGMKLLSSLIKGKVWLTSTEADGTTFFAEFHSF